MRKLFTSESVTEGHPDKMADQISDAILDAIIANDPTARVACETLITTGMVIVAGEISTKCYVDIPKIVRKTIEEIGYTSSEYGFDSKTCAVLLALDEQSSDIALGVDNSLESKTDDTSIETKETKETKESKTSESDKQLGAGDQGLMFGYACNETLELMPVPIVLAHKLAKQLAGVRKNNILPLLRPDGKTQVTVEYENDRPIRVDKILISTQHHPDYKLSQIKDDLIEHVINEIIPTKLMDHKTEILVNPTGRFVIGGPHGDTGLTGRKIIVDTYGGFSKHGGGAFSGKDPTKVDRSASYAARYVARNIVAVGLADRCEVQLAYAIGVAIPVSIMVDTFGTEKVPINVIESLIKKHFDLRPSSIIKELNLRRPIYNQVAKYGHFGRLDLELSWENTKDSLYQDSLRLNKS